VDLGGCDTTAISSTRGRNRNELQHNTAACIVGHCYSCNDRPRPCRGANLAEGMHRSVGTYLVLFVHRTRDYFINSYASSLLFDCLTCANDVIIPCAGLFRKAFSDGLWRLTLVPVQLKLLNGFTPDCDGTVITSIIPAPENPNYSVDLAYQAYQNSQGALVQDSTLGPKGPGRGRLDANGLAYDLLVAAKAPPISSLHYEWERRRFRYEWLILQKQNPSRWEVICRDVSGPADDTNNSFSNNTPSAGHQEFYNYDASGISYDPSVEEDPSIIDDSLMSPGDYRYCEKVFSYKVRYSLDTPSWTEENANWTDGAEIFTSQKILVQQVNKTNLVTQDWITNYDLFFTGKINPQINMSKVRQIVGGNIPIVLDPSATAFNQVDPPDTDTVATSQ
jgi:hypothetical protein